MKIPLYFSLCSIRDLKPTSCTIFPTRQKLFLPPLQLKFREKLFRSPQIILCQYRPIQKRKPRKKYVPLLPDDCTCAKNFLETKYRTTNPSHDNLYRCLLYTSDAA